LINNILKRFCYSVLEKLLLKADTARQIYVTKWSNGISGWEIPSSLIYFYWWCHRALGSAIGAAGICCIFWLFEEHKLGSVWSNTCKVSTFQRQHVIQQKLSFSLVEEISITLNDSLKDAILFWLRSLHLYSNTKRFGITSIQKESLLVKFSNYLVL
jgi:hypothetical protein